MTNFRLWDEYLRAAGELCAQDPQRTRLVAKYRHCDARLVLKVTNDKKCLKFKADKLQDVNKLERLTRILMATMQNRPEVPEDPADDRKEFRSDPANKDAQQSAAQPAAASGGSKKGKKKGRK